MTTTAKTAQTGWPAATFPREPRPDEPELSNLLGQHRLVALNTWQPLSPHTFVQGDARTQIDFILTRQISAGRQAKQASPLLDLPLESWKKGPIQAFVTPLPGPQIKQHDPAALQEAVRANSPQAQRMLEWVTEGPQAWDELLIGATERFPKRRWHCLTVRKLPQLEGSGALDGEMRIAPRRNPQLNCLAGSTQAGSQAGTNMWHTRLSRCLSHGSQR